MEPGFTCRSFLTLSGKIYFYSPWALVEHLSFYFFNTTMNLVGWHNYRCTLMLSNTLISFCGKELEFKTAGSCDGNARCAAGRTNVFLRAGLLGGVLSRNTSSVTFNSVLNLAYIIRCCEGGRCGGGEDSFVYYTYIPHQLIPVCHFELTGREVGYKSINKCIPLASTQKIPHGKPDLPGLPQYHIIELA